MTEQSKATTSGNSVSDLIEDLDDLAKNFRERTDRRASTLDGDTKSQPLDGDTKSQPLDGDTKSQPEEK